MNRSLRLTQEEKETIEQKLQHPSLPSVLEQAIESYITQKVGKPWNDPIILERIRSAILAQKATYWKDGSRRTITYRKGYQVFAYLSYQMPVYFLQF